MAVLGSETKKRIEGETVRDLLLSSASRHADRVAFRQKGADGYFEFTYRRFRSDVQALGVELSSMVNGERRVMIVGDNCYEWALSYLACLSGAGIAVPVDKDFSEEELLKLANFAEVSVVLYSDSVAEKLVTLPNSVKKVSFTAFEALLCEGREKIDAGEDDFWELPMDKQAPAALFFTSASTGTPKGVLLSHENLCTTLCGSATLVDIDESDNFLCTLPLHHIFECTCTLLGSLAVGASVSFGEGLRHIIRNMREVRPTVLVCVPMIVEALAKWISAERRTQGTGVLMKATGLLPATAALGARRKMFSGLHKKLGGNLRMIISGGAPVHPEMLKTVRSVGIATVEGYGLCECAPVVTVNPVSAFRVGSVGVALPDSILDIYNVQEDGRGEIRYKGKNAMLGYFKNDVLTAEVKRGDWLYTGDLGYLDKDGYLYIVGRKKNAMVMANGKHVYPEEIEAMLTKYLFVKEAIVVGYINEKKGDNDLVAVIHPDYDMIRSVYGDIYTRLDVETELAAILLQVNAALPMHKRLSLFLVKDTPFAKHRSRKIRRTGVAEAVYEEYLAAKKN